MGDVSAIAAATAVERQEVRITEAGGGAGAWLVVITKGSSERIVRDRLQAQAFEAYLPMRLLSEALARKRGIAATPLFPRFVFARATLDAYRWQAIFSTIGVQRVLCDPKKPRGIKPEFVERLRAREIDGFLKIGLRDPNRPEPPAPPPKDTRAWVKLQDIIDGLCTEQLDANRSSVLLSLLSEGRGVGRAALTQDIRRF